MIITTWGDDFACSVSSPQLPGIVAAYDEHPSPVELFQLAVAAGLAPDGNVDVHIQVALEVDGKQFFVRCRHDHRANDRGRLATQIEEELRQEPELREYADEDKYGDAVVVATLASDRIVNVIVGAEVDQPLTIGMRSSEGAMHYIGMIAGDSGSQGRRLSDLGLDISSTVGQMFAKLGVGSATHQHGKILVTA